MKGSAEHALESSAQLILEVAKAASSHLELAEVLEALIVALKPTIHFHAIAVIVMEGEDVRLHSLHVEGVDRRPGEAVESVVARAASSIRLPQMPVLKQPRSEHHLSLMVSSRRPYVRPDLQRDKSFPADERLLQYGIQSYVSLPLLRRGELIGAVEFLSFEKQAFTDADVRLLQDVSELVSIAVSNALAYEEIKALKEQLQAENRLLQDEIVQRSIYEEIVGSSPALRSVLTAIERVAPTDSTVLLTGETGTGKELIAHAIHRRSPRSARALVKVNCAALPAELIASELFGHEKGAFTGAIRQQLGKFELASGGTLFLDEIGDLRLDLQAKLLRAIQESEIERVGGTHPIKTEFRLIAATNVDLERAVKEGTFREDLYYRLNVIPIRMPPLRERIEDLPDLARFFLRRYNVKFRKSIQGIADSTVKILGGYWWPGNIRELENLVERLVAVTDKDWITDEDLPYELHVAQLDVDGPTTENVLERALSTFERNFIVRALEKSGWNVTATARSLGIPLSTLKFKMDRLDIRELARKLRGN